MIRHTVNPFPGMNPYLESSVNWSDFHATFINSLRDHISARLPEPYFARIDVSSVMLAPDLERPKGFEPDVLVGRTPVDVSEWDTPRASTAVLEPTTLANIEHLDPHTEAFIEIVKLPERELITVIELFSPTNKSGDGRGFYMEKRQAILRSQANIVELDLLRGGRRLQLSKPLPPDHYYAFISRGDRRPQCDVYHWSVRQPMPTLPLPLSPLDPDITIDLADPFKVAFERGQYGRFIDYNQPPPPPALRSLDASWVTQLLGDSAQQNSPSN